MSEKWAAAWRSFSGVAFRFGFDSETKAAASLPGIALEFGFDSAAEAALWLVLNIPRSDIVGVFQGDAETMKKWVEEANRRDAEGGGRDVVEAP